MPVFVGRVEVTSCATSTVRLQLLAQLAGAGIHLAIPSLLYPRAHPILKEVLPSLQEDTKQNRPVCVSQGTLGSQWGGKGCAKLPQ